MATNVEELNTLELYFFGPLALVVLRRHKTVIGALMIAEGTAQWLADIERSVPQTRDAVEKQIKEEADVTAALAAAGVHLEKLGPWRRVIERTAFSTKDKTRREELLKVAGYGLGQVESPKEAKEFLVNVKPLVEMRKDMLLGRGLAPAVVDFPINTLAAMESESGNVAKEKAEAALAGTHTRKCRAELSSMLDRADDSVEILVQQSLFLDPAQRKAVEDLSAEWLAALNEARVLTRKRVEQGDVPPSLVDGPSTTPPATTPAGTPG